MTRLTQSTRIQVCRALIERYEAPRREALAQQEFAVAGMAIDTYLGATQWNATPKEWFQPSTWVTWQFHKGRRDSYRRAALAASQALPWALATAHAEINNPRLEVAYQEWQSAKNGLATTLTKLRDQIDAALNATTTIAKLLELWPEIGPFLPKSAQIVNLPAVNLAPLNKALGIELKQGVQHVKG